MDWGSIIAAAVPAVVSSASSLLGQKQQEDRAQEQFDQQRAIANEERLFQLQLAELKARYGSGGGGGGGADKSLTEAQKLAAVAGQGELQQNAITNLLAGLRGAYGGR